MDRRKLLNFTLFQHIFVDQSNQLQTDFPKQLMITGLIPMTHFLYSAVVTPLMTIQSPNARGHGRVCSVCAYVCVVFGFGGESDLHPSHPFWP